MLSIKVSCPLHFADYTCFLNIQSSIKQINRTLNKDLKQLSLWLNANKISLNVAKTKVILFKPKNKQLDTDLKLTLCRKRLYTTTQVKYLGILNDDKLRYYVNKEISRTIYFAIFHSYLNYFSTVWGQTKIPKKHNCPSEKSIKNYELCTI